MANSKQPMENAALLRFDTRKNADELDYFLRAARLGDLRTLTEVREQRPWKSAADEAPALDEALNYAAGQNHLPCAKALLTWGADPNCATPEGSPLLWATWNGHSEMVRLLIIAGADTSKRMRVSFLGSFSALDMAESRCFTEVECVIQKAGSVGPRTAEQVAPAVAQFSEWWWAAEAGHLSLVKEHIEKGALSSLAEPNSCGRAAVDLAASAGQDDVVRLLVGAGETPIPPVIAGMRREHANLRARVKFSSAYVRALAAAEPNHVYKLVLRSFLKDPTSGLADAVRLASLATYHSRLFTKPDPSTATALKALSERIQLTAAAFLLQLDGSSVDGLDFDRQGYTEAGQLLGNKEGENCLRTAAAGGLDVLLASTPVQNFLHRKWLGTGQYFSSIFALDGYRTFERLFFLLLNLVVAPFVEIVPPLGKAFQRWAARNAPLYFLNSPLLKFALRSVSDITFIVLLVLYSKSTANTSSSAYWVLLSHAVGGAWNDALAFWKKGGPAALVQARDGSPSPVLSDLFSLIDVLARWILIIALVGGGVNAARSDGPTYEPGSGALEATDGVQAFFTILLSIGIFVLVIAQLRLACLSPYIGPLVLAVFVIVKADATLWLMIYLCFAVAFVMPNFIMFQSNAELTAAFSSVDECSSLAKNNWFGWFVDLIEDAATGTFDDYFACLDNSPPVVRGYMHFLGLLFVLVNFIILINLLIALMTKSFDRVSELSYRAYLYIFTQTVLYAELLSPSPPPFNLLSAPYGIARIVIRAIRDRLSQKAPSEGLSRSIELLTARPDDAAATAAPDASPCRNVDLACYFARDAAGEAEDTPAELASGERDTRGSVRPSRGKRKFVLGSYWHGENTLESLVVNASELVAASVSGGAALSIPEEEGSANACQLGAIKDALRQLHKQNEELREMMVKALGAAGKDAATFAPTTLPGHQGQSVSGQL